MRILHVVPTYWPAVRYGGPIVSVHALCRELAAAGHDVEVYTTTVDGDGDLPVEPGQPVDVEGVRVRYFSTSTPRRLYRSPAMGAALERAMPDFDVVHLHSVFLWPTLAAARAAERHGVPFVLSPRGMLSRPLIRERGKLRKEAWIAAFERRTIQRAAFVHTTSRVETRELEDLGLRTVRIVTIPNGVDPPEAREASRTPPSGAPQFLYLGRLSWKKALPDLIDAVSDVPEVSLVLAGPDDEELAPQLLERAERLGIGARVRYVGQVQGHAKWDLIADSDALVLPSRNENFGNVVLEAMAMSRPIVCTDTVGAADLVRSARAGIVSPTGPAGLAQAIRDLLSLSFSERRAMGSRGHELARAHRWPQVAERMLGAYRSVAERRIECAA